MWLLGCYHRIGPTRVLEQLNLSNISLLKLTKEQLRVQRMFDMVFGNYRIIVSQV